MLNWGNGSPSRRVSVRSFSSKNAANSNLFFSFSAKIREGITNLVLSVYWAMQLRRLGREKWTGFASTSYALISIEQQWANLGPLFKKGDAIYESALLTVRAAKYISMPTPTDYCWSIYSKRNGWKRITFIVNAKNKSNMIAQIRPVMYEYYSFCIGQCCFTRN